ncbi:hypothetical protein EBQ93_03575 [bacterium]|nr:hypothetical protein [bacterium]
MKHNLFFLTFALLATQTFVQASEEDGCSGRAGGGGAQTTASTSTKRHKIHGRAASCSRKVIDPTLRTGYLWNPRPEDLFAELIDSVNPDTALDTGYSKESKDAAAQRLVNGIKKARTPEQRYSFIQWIIDNAQEAKDTQLDEALKLNADWQEIIADLEKPIIKSTQTALTARNTHAIAVSTESAKLAALQANHRSQVRGHKETTDAAQEQARKEHAARVAQALWKLKKEFRSKSARLETAHDEHNTALTTVYSTAETVASRLIQEAQKRTETAIAQTAAHHPIAALLTGAALELGVKLSEEFTDALAQRDELLGVKKSAPIAVESTEWGAFEEAPRAAISAPTVPATTAETTTPTHAASLPGGYLCTIIVPNEDEAPETETGVTDDALEHSAALFKQAKKSRNALMKQSENEHSEKGHIKPTSKADRIEQKSIVRRLIQQQVDKARNEQERSE